jgi:hypothetical protein
MSIALADAILYAAEQANVALDPREIEVSTDPLYSGLWVENTRVILEENRVATVQSQSRPLSEAAGHAVAEVVHWRLNKHFGKLRSEKARLRKMGWYGNHDAVMWEARRAAKAAGMRGLVTTSDQETGIHIEAATMEYLPSEDRPANPGRWRVTSPLVAEYSDYLDHALLDALWAAIWMRTMREYM